MHDNFPLLTPAFARGSYDLRVAEKCSALFKAGVAPILLFPGKSGNWTKNKWEETEEVVLSRHAIELGVTVRPTLVQHFRLKESEFAGL